MDICLCCISECFCHWNKLKKKKKHVTTKGKGQENNRRDEIIKYHINADRVHYANWYYANT